MKTICTFLFFFGISGFLYAQNCCDADRPCPCPSSHKPSYGLTHKSGSETTGKPPAQRDPKTTFYPPPMWFPEASPFPTSLPSDPEQADPVKFLDKHGPQFGNAYSMSAFSVLGMPKEIGQW